MASVELKFFTFKTVFLLSLASGARQGKIHTLDWSPIRWLSDGKDVFLRPYVGFMAKTHVARDPSTALMDFWIKSLAAMLDRSEPDMALCPLRVLRFYLE